MRWLACHVVGLNWPYESQLLWTLRVPGALVFCPAFLFLEGVRPVFPSLAEGVPSAVLPSILSLPHPHPAAHRSPSLNENSDRNGPPVSQDSFCDMGRWGLVESEEGLDPRTAGRAQTSETPEVGPRAAGLCTRPCHRSLGTAVCFSLTWKSLSSGRCGRRSAQVLWLRSLYHQGPSSLSQFQV